MIEPRHQMLRYAGGLLLVLAIHAVAVYLALNWRTSNAIELPPAAMVVELAPLPEPAPPPPPQIVQPPQPPAPEEELPLPKVVEAPKPVIEVPKPEKPKPKKPQPPKPVKKVEPPKEEAPPEQKTVDTPPTPAKPEKSAAPTPSAPPAPPSNALPNWQSDLLRHLAKFKEYPMEARRRGITGANNLRFTVDAEGRVLSFEIIKSSGNAALDRATLEMIRRAQPLPKPPPEILINGSLNITAPFLYSLDRR